MARVLIVDDDPAILEILHVYLSGEGYEVLQASDGHQARELLPRADIAILDWMLPGVSSLDLARETRTAGLELPLLMLTARGEEEDKLRGLDLGVDDYVVKPFSPREVVARVRALLRRAGVRHEIRSGELELDLRTRHPPRKSRLDPYHERLWERWNAGERNAMALMRQVRQKRFSGGDKAVHQWTLARRIEEAEQSELPTEAVPAERKPRWRRADFLAGQVVWLLLREDAGLQPDDRTLLDALTKTCAPVNEMRRLALDFRQLFRDGNAQRLDGWLEQAARSGLPDIQTLATSLVREREALLAAITLPWSNGPTEGVVNKIKLIKRQMYGRGSFETLRQRVLLAS